MSSKYNCVIDAGNTSIKAGVFFKKELLEKHHFEHLTAFEQWAGTRQFRYAIVSSVNQQESDFTESLKADRVILFGPATAIPINNQYKTPETLGRDRLASAVGAWSLHRANTLVIDAGTCVTYDFVTAKAQYVGGAISPGLHMRFKALHHFTARLPLIETSSHADLIGTDTATSILSGVVNGLAFEIEKTIEEYTERYPNLKVILCGGDTHFFESKIKGGIFAFPDLVLHGLNFTLLHNALH